MSDDKDEMTGASGAPANDFTGMDPGEPGDDGLGSSDRRLLQIESELNETKDQLLRALAETENVRRRLQRDRDDAQRYAVTGFAKDLLSTADNLRRALEALPEAEVTDPRVKGMLEGVAATERELLGAFERHGLKRIDPKGQRFDHNFHQAIFEAERPGAAAGTVIEVLQPGYVLQDRLLRPAMVGVAKGSGAPSEGTDDAA
ncbi:MAG: nucleotide exchange factor GrpE [Alphaproteobacteria bacterium]|nr:nucleotide exchange factor GrpE [Alphaproteobacteria bacterium]